MNTFIYYANIQTFTSLLFSLVFVLMALFVSKKTNVKLSIIWTSLSVITGIISSGLSWLLTIIDNADGLDEADNFATILWLIIVFGICGQVSTFLTGYLLDLINTRNDILTIINGASHELEPSIYKKQIIISIVFCITVFIILSLFGLTVAYFL